MVRRLENHKIDARLLVLHSVGCSHRLYAATKSLNQQLGERFGILLWWEDTFRRMKRSRFSVAGLDIDTLQTYTEDAETDCHDWKSG